MAEALGIASAVINLGEVSYAVVKLIRQFKDAPDELLAIHNEVVDLQALAFRVQNVAAKDTEASQMLRPPLQNALKYASGMKAILDSVAGPAVGVPVKWLRYRHRAMKLQHGLREAKRSLHHELSLLAV